MLSKKNSSLLILSLLTFTTVMLFFISPPGASSSFLRTKDAKILSFTGNSVFDTGDELLFYNNIRFKERNITYSINKNCNSKRSADIRKAFNILQNKTILAFKEQNNSAWIKINCPKKEKSLKKEKHIAGAGGPSHIINTTKYNLILDGNVELYQEEECEKPVVALHEILHVLGFKHKKERISIMHKTSLCTQKLTFEIVNKINELYQDPALPDLTFRRLNATKTANLIDFEAEIVNAGLEDTENTTISVLNNDKEIARYDLENFELGTGKIIQVNNLRSPKKISSLAVVVDLDNAIKEIDENNNQKNISV